MAVLVSCFQILILTVPFLYGQLGTNHFKVTKFAMCNATAKYKWYVNSTFKTVNNLQYLDVDSTYLTPLGENSDCKNEISASLDGKHFRHLFTISERDTCKCLKTYVGDLFYDYVRASGVVPFQCPIPKGSYHVRNHPLKFDKIPLQTFPRGVIRMKASTRNLQTKEVLFCADVEVKN